MRKGLKSIEPFARGEQFRRIEPAYKPRQGAAVSVSHLGPPCAHTREQRRHEMLEPIAEWSYARGT
jgi:hypothetical protein